MHNACCDDITTSKALARAALGLFFGNILGVLLWYWRGRSETTAEHQTETCCYYGRLYLRCPILMAVTISIFVERRGVAKVDRISMAVQINSSSLKGMVQHHSNSMPLHSKCSWHSSTQRHDIPMQCRRRVELLGPTCTKLRELLRSRF